MVRFAEYFFYDYILYKNIEDFLKRKKGSFRIAESLSEKCETTDEEISLKLVLNKMLSILTAKECKNYPICCKFEFEVKLGRILHIMSKSTDTSAKNLFDFLTKVLLIITKNHGAFENKGFEKHRKDYNKKLQRVLWGNGFRKERELCLGVSREKKEKESVDIQNKNTMNQRRISGTRIFKKKYISTKLVLGTEVYSKVFMKVIRREIRKIFLSFQVPFLATITEQKLAEIKKKQLRSAENGQIITWSADNTVDEEKQ